MIFRGLAFAQSVANDEDRLTLGQGMVAEADFDRPVDHAALGYVLKRRWQAVCTRGPCPSFSDYARTYVSAFKPHVRSPRVQWVRELTLAGDKPASWPENLSWTHYRPKWLATLDRAQGVLDGTLADPCGGKASQWGSPLLATDRVRAARAIQAGRWVPARCAGMTANNFYRER